MELLGLILTLGFLGFLFIVGCAFAAILSSRRGAEYERRIADLEQAVARLERGLRAAGARAPGPGAEAGETAAPTRTPTTPRPAAPPLPPLPSRPSAPPPLATPRPESPSAPPVLGPGDRGVPASAPPLSPRSGPPSGAREALASGAVFSSPGAGQERATTAGTERAVSPASVGRIGSGERPFAGLGGPPGTSSPIDWERWIGIRGAAVLGGIALAIAALLLFQYSIQHGLITPAMRVGIGIVSGIACLVVSEALKSRGYRYAPEATSGAGVVFLYAAFWAAYELYALIGLGSAFALMGLTTLACCLLSLRHASQIIAVLGLAGGFATPLFLRSDANRPFGLFGYTLLLDLGLIAIGRTRRWPILGLLSVVGTLILQMSWTGARMTPDQYGLALGILGLFALLFAASGEARPDADDPQATWIWRVSQAMGVLLPFLFAMWFAGRTDLGPHLYPLALLMGPIVAAAGVLGRRGPSSMIGILAACGCVAVTGVWMLQRTLTMPLMWEAVAVAAALTVLFHVFAELDWSDARLEGPATAVVLATAGFYLVTIVAAGIGENAGFWPLLALWIFLSAVLMRLASQPERAPIAIVAGIGTGLGLAVFHLTHDSNAAFPGWKTFLVVAAGLAAAASSVSAALPAPRPRSFAARTAAILPAIVLFSLPLSPHLARFDPLLGMGSTLILGILVAVPAAIVPEGVWLALGAGLAAITQSAWTWSQRSVSSGLPTELDQLYASGWNPSANGSITFVSPESAARLALLPALAAALIFTAWPFAARRRLGGDKAAWAAAILAIPAWFLALRRLFETAFGKEAIGVLPLGLAALAAGAAVLAHRGQAPAELLRRHVLVGFGASAFALAAVAVPLQFSNEWITIGWAVEGLLALALWHRLAHSGLKWGALGLFALVAARLLLNAEVLSYHPRSATRILNWIALTYLVPAAAMLAGAWILRGREVARSAPWEAGLYAAGHEVGRVGASLGGIFVIFAWLNLTVLDWFATGPELRLHLAHLPACDLTLSIVWAVFALALLGFGMAGGSVALRWLSLGFLVLTIGKVFLYDLGQLKDLYRVGAFVGLALSLLLVSLLYQKFVFRKAPE